MATKIIDQTKTWTVILNGAAASLNLEAALASSNGDEDSANRIRDYARNIKSVAQDIHKRFVEGNENKPPRTRKKKGQTAGNS